MTDRSGYDVSYDYSRLNQVTKLTCPGEGSIPASDIYYRYDEMGRLTDILDNDNTTVIAHFTYDGLNRQVGVTYCNGTSMSYDYNDLTGNDNVGDTLKTVTTTLTNGGITYGYTYDDVGNHKSMLITATGNYTNLSRSVCTYNYDHLYQLGNVQQGGSIPFGYIYDSVGNRTWSKENALEMDYSTAGNSLNQYSSINDPIYLPHDDNGNMLYDRTYEYAYDARNRLIAVAGVASYQYDFAGRRIKKTTAMGITYYVYDGANLIAEFDGTTGNLKYRYIYGPGIDRPVAMISFTGPVPVWYYYHQDALGNVVALSNNSGTLVESYEYTPFGKPTIHSPGSDGIWGNGDDTTLSSSAYGNRFMFTGREYDSETGLYYYRARMYKPEFGRFLQPDPIGYADSMNLYQYCLNNPANWIDPWGLMSMGEPFTKGIGLGIDRNRMARFATWGLIHSAGCIQIGASLINLRCIENNLARLELAQGTIDEIRSKFGSLAGASTPSSPELDALIQFLSLITSPEAAETLNEAQRILLKRYLEELKNIKKWKERMERSTIEHPDPSYRSNDPCDLSRK